MPELVETSLNLEFLDLPHKGLARAVQSFVRLQKSPTAQSQHHGENLNRGKTCMGIDGGVHFWQVDKVDEVDEARKRSLNSCWIAVGHFGGEDYLSSVTKTLGSSHQIMNHVVQSKAEPHMTKHRSTERILGFAPTGARTSRKGSSLPA
jgi:hypothetical protein